MSNVRDVIQRVRQAMVDVILNQGALGLANGFFHRMQLLGNIHAGTAILDHGDDAAQVALGAFEPFDDVSVTLMVVMAFMHDLSPLSV